MTDLPTIIGPAGLQPQPPASLLAQLISLVSAVRPGYTANLPASLVEDISSTDVYAIAMIDQARVELVNSLTPYGANVFLLAQLGQMLGVPQGATTNTSVFVIFTGPPGYVIPQGFTVSDGTHQYTVQDGGVIGTSTVSDQLFCLATQPGIWAVPSGTVTQIVTSYPSSVTLSVVNSEAGLPGTGTESEASYRTRVLQANRAESQGMATYLKTLLTNVSGVQPRLVSVVQQTGGGWSVICGGGDPYEVSYAILYSLFDISLITGSLLEVTAITNANPGVVTTSLTHNFTSGDIINIVGVVGMSGVNNVPITVTVISSTTFSIGINTTSSGTYTSGGIVTPNSRNIDVSLNDYPDTYDITYISPPQQSVSIIVNWDTNSQNFVSSAAIAQTANPAIVEYINSIAAGQPINLNVMSTVFATSIASILPTDLLSLLTFIVSIDGIATSPTAGTQLVEGDAESYFLTQSSNIIIAQV